jgi:ParB family chromosome partitioning protein
VVARLSGLGKGLSALIPDDGGTSTGGAFQEIPIRSVKPNSHQPRVAFDEDALVSLTASINELGVLQPILVRKVGDDSYELIAGERRWRAAKRAGLQTIPALIREVEDVHALEQALVENLHREDLNALEEAAAFQQLIEDFGLTHEQVAQRVGKSRSAVSNTLRLFQLPPSVQKFVGEGRLSAGHARALLGTPDRSFQESLARKAVQDDLSVRAVEEAVRVREQGSVAAPSAATAKPSVARPAGMLELEALLSEHLSTKVNVTMGSKRGKVVIDFATLDDLERIYRAMTEPQPSTSPY